MDMMQAVHNANLFAGMIHSSAGISAWCFSMKTRKLFYSTCPYEETFLRFLQMNGCLDFMFSTEIDNKRPVFLGTPIGLLWAADYIYYSEEEKRPALAIVIGPFFSSEISARGLRADIREMNLSVSVESNVIRQLQNIPVLPLSSIFRYVTMLHYALTEEKITSFDIQYQHWQKEDEKEAPDRDWDEEGMGKPDFEDREAVAHYYTVEQTILQLIREGNAGYREILREKAGGITGNEKEKPLRDEKDAMIILTGLSLRAAMEGGMPQGTARKMETLYLQKIEEAGTIAEVMHIREDLLEDLTGRVHQCQSRADISRPVQACCDFIAQNLTKKLALSDIARAVGYSQYYLTKKFRREMGIRLTDYIKERRIEMAKVWLITTTRSIEDISEQLQFGTRGYFSKVFREQTGTSPGAYRNRAMQFAEETGTDAATKEKAGI